MMDSILSKVILFLASILSIGLGASYIKIGVDNLTFDFKTGEIYPIYYFLNIQNIGPEKERFEISSDSAWVSGSREGTDYTFVELPSQAYVNFVLTIRPERLPDGVNEAKINLRVLDIDSLVSQEVILDETEVSIVLNKNIIPIESSQPVLSPAMTPAPTSIQTVSPTQTPVLTPQPTETSQTPSTDLNPILKQIQSLIDSIRMFLKNFF